MDGGSGRETMAGVAQLIERVSAASESVGKPDFMTLDAAGREDFLRNEWGEAAALALHFRALLVEALAVMGESVNNRDGRDDLQLGCPNCDGALPMPHSLGCRIRQAVAS